MQTLVNAGIDFIKDDELQANGPYCPLPERIAAVTRVLNEQADKTGKRVIYAFNITDEVDQMWRNLDLLHAHGGICAMVCMNSIGLGRSQGSDLPYPSRLKTKAPQPVTSASLAGNSCHMSTQPNPSCRKTKVRASSGEGPCQVNSRRLSSIFKYLFFGM